MPPLAAAASESRPYPSTLGALFRSRSLFRALVAAVVPLALAAACTVGDDGASEPTPTVAPTVSATPTAAPTPTPAPSPTTEVPPELTVAVGRWPACVDPLASCADEPWLLWSVLTHVLPRAMELDDENRYVASPVLARAPTVDNGGLVVGDDGTFTLTYEISPDAVWSDGTPITSADFRATWEAITASPDADQTGYDRITSIDDSDPAVAVIGFAGSYGPWADLFGGARGFLLPAHAYDPATWVDAIPVSAGPYQLESWSDERHVLVADADYWVPERVPLVDRVVFVPTETTDDALGALRRSEVLVAAPAPFPGAIDRLADDGLAVATGDSDVIEALWINQAADTAFEVDQAVRQALAYALDRVEVARVGLGALVDDPAVLQCAGWNPSYGPWCEPEFERYAQDPAMVEEVLLAAGWTRPDPGGPWVDAAGTPLVLEWSTTAGDTRREEVQAAVVEMTRPLGIEWEIVNEDATVLLTEQVPLLEYGPVGMWFSRTHPDPSVADRYRISAIPGPENGYTGGNITAYRDETAAALTTAIDAEVDREARLGLVRELGARVAETVPWIPLYVVPRLCAWDPAVVGGAVCSGVASAYGPYAGLEDWTLGRVEGGGP